MTARRKSTRVRKQTAPAAVRGAAGSRGRASASAAAAASPGASLPVPAWVPYAVLVTVVIVAYLPSLSGEFLWDDDTSVTASKMVQDPGGWWKAWVAPLESHPDYFPLTTTVFWLEWRLWGDHALGYRVVNLLLHAGTAVLLWRLFRALRLSGAWWAAAAVALHPVNAESVAWVSELKNVLCLIFAVPAMHFYVRWQEGGAGGDYRNALLCHGAALAAKASCAGLPVVMAVYAVWRTRARPKLLPLLPFLALSLLFGLLVMQFQHDRAVGRWEIPMPDWPGRMAGAARAYWFYVGKVLWPFGLATVYPRWALEPVSAGAWALLSGTVAGLGGLWWRGWRTGSPAGRAEGGASATGTASACAWGAAFGLTAYGLLLAPALGLIKMSYMVYSLVADHFQHLALPALVGTVAGGVGSLGPWIQRTRPSWGWERWAPWLAGGLVCVLGGLTWERAGVHASPERLWSDAVKKNPQSDQAHTALGSMLSARGRKEEAARHFLEAGRLGSSTALTNLGLRHFQRNEFAEALPWFEQALTKKNPPNLTYLFLGQTYFEVERIEDGLRVLEQGANLFPNDLELNATLGAAFVTVEQPERARPFLERAVQAKRGHKEAMRRAARTLLEKIGPRGTVPNSLTEP